MLKLNTLKQQQKNFNSNKNNNNNISTATKITTVTFHQHSLENHKNVLNHMTKCFVMSAEKDWEAEENPANGNIYRSFVVYTLQYFVQTVRWCVIMSYSFHWVLIIMKPIEK